MNVLALATDYDGTLATEGLVLPDTLAALQRLRDSGRKLVLVTGRELEDLERIFDRFDLFDAAVLENGALLLRPDTGALTQLGEPPPAAFVDALAQRGVPRISVGHVIVATWRPHETAVLETIRDFGLEHQIIFNKDAVMILPPGVNKASGLEAALAGLGIEARRAAGIGDAENDHSFMALCGWSAAVDNALPTLKQEATLVTRGARGAGVVELIERILATDLADLPRQA